MLSIYLRRVSVGEARQCAIDAIRAAGLDDKAAKVLEDLAKNSESLTEADFEGAADALTAYAYKKASNKAKVTKLETGQTALVTVNGKRQPLATFGLMNSIAPQSASKWSASFFRPVSIASGKSGVDVWSHNAAPVMQAIQTQIDTEIEGAFNALSGVFSSLINRNFYLGIKLDKKTAYDIYQERIGVDTQNKKAKAFNKKFAEVLAPYEKHLKDNMLRNTLEPYIPRRYSVTKWTQNVERTKEFIRKAIDKNGLSKREIDQIVDDVYRGHAGESTSSSGYHRTIKYESPKMELMMLQEFGGDLHEQLEHEVRDTIKKSISFDLLGADPKAVLIETANRLSERDLADAGSDKALAREIQQARDMVYSYAEIEFGDQSANTYTELKAALSASASARFLPGMWVWNSTVEMFGAAQSMAAWQTNVGRMQKTSQQVIDQDLMGTPTKLVKLATRSMVGSFERLTSAIKKSGIDEAEFKRKMVYRMGIGNAMVHGIYMAQHRANSAAKVASYMFKGGAQWSAIVSGNTTFIEAQRNAVGVESLIGLSSMADMPLSKLKQNSIIGDRFNDLGLTAEVWDEIRSAKHRVTDPDVGDMVLDSSKMDDYHRRIFNAVIATETNMALVRPDAYTRLMGKEVGGDSAAGLMHAAVMQFQQYPIQLVKSILGRRAREGAVPVGSYLIGTYLSAMLGAQMYALLTKGEVYEMDSLDYHARVMEMGTPLWLYGSVIGGAMRTASRVSDEGAGFDETLDAMARSGTSTQAGTLPAGTITSDVRGAIAASKVVAQSFGEDDVNPYEKEIAIKQFMSMFPHALPFTFVMNELMFGWVDHENPDAEDRREETREKTGRIKVVGD